MGMSHRVLCISTSAFDMVAFDIGVDLLLREMDGLPQRVGAQGEHLFRGADSGV